jgi:hypothetical protein
MSGTPPYIYYALGETGALQAAGANPSALLYAYDAETTVIIDAGNTELFNPGCLMGQLQTTEPELEHPVNSYNTNYPYCRTTIKYRMDDPRSNPQLAQLISAAPYLVIRLQLTGCSKSDIVSVISRLEPKQSQGCGAELYFGYDPTELYMLLSMSILSLPVRLTFTITTANGTKKEFWVGVRDGRTGVPSGAVV